MEKPSRREARWFGFLAIVLLAALCSQSACGVKSARESNSAESPSPSVTTETTTTPPKAGIEEDNGSTSSTTPTPTQTFTPTSPPSPTNTPIPTLTPSPTATPTPLPPVISADTFQDLHLQRVFGDPSFGYSHFWSSDGDQLTLLARNSVAQYDAATLVESRSIQLPLLPSRGAFSPDGGRLVFSCYETRSPLTVSVHVFDLNEKSLTYLSSFDSFTRVESAADTAIFAFCSSDGVRIWDMDSQTWTQSLVGRSITDCSLSADGSRLATIGNWQTGNGWPDSEWKIWDVESGSVIFSQYNDFNWNRQVALSPDGNLAAVGGTSGLDVWDIQAGTSLQHTGGNSMQDLVFSPDASLLAFSVFNSRHIRLLEISSGRVDNMSGPDSGKPDVTSVGFSPDGSELVAVADDWVRVWDLDTKRTKETLLNDSIDTSAMSPAGDVIVIARPPTETWEFEFVQISSGEVLRRFTVPDVGNDEHLWTPRFSADGQSLLFFSNSSGLENPSSRVILMDVSSGEALFSTPLHIIIWSVSVSRDEQEIIVAGWSPNLRILDARSGQLVREIQGVTDDDRRTSQTNRSLINVDWAAYDSSGQMIATVDSDEAVVKVWKAETGELLWQLPNADVSSAIWHPFESILATIDRTGMVRLWDATEGVLVHEISAEADPLLLLVDPTGEFFVIASKSTYLQAWSFDTGQLISSVEATGWYHEGGFSEDGRTLYLRNYSQVEIWRVGQVD